MSVRKAVQLRKCGVRQVYLSTFSSHRRPWHSGLSLFVFVPAGAGVSPSLELGCKFAEERFECVIITFAHHRFFVNLYAMALCMTAIKLSF